MEKIKQDLSFMSHYQQQLLKKFLELGFSVKALEAIDIAVIASNDRNIFFIEEYTSLVPHNIGLILTNQKLVDSVLQFNNIRIGEKRVIRNFEEFMKKADKFSFPVAIGLKDAYRPLFYKKIKKPTELLSLIKEINSGSRVIVYENNFWENMLSIYYDSSGFVNILASRLIASDEEVNIAEDITAKAHHSVKKLARSVLACFPGLGAISFVARVKDPFREINNEYSVEVIYHTNGNHYQHNAIKGGKEAKVIDRIVEQILIRI
jgi:hypothetical protein